MLGLGAGVNVVVMQPAACSNCGSAEIQAFVPELYNGGRPVKGEGGLFCPQCFSLFPQTAEPALPQPQIPELSLGGYARAEVPASSAGSQSKAWSMVRAFCRGELRVKVRIVRNRRRTLVLANTTLQPRLRT